LETLEEEVRRVIEDPSKHAHRRMRRLPARRRAGWAVLLPVACILLAGGTLALAATGVILTGSTVPAAPPVGPAEGIGAPVSSRLLPLRAQDPEGGLPWGMRIVETSRGLVCAQVGRIEDGQLGELGMDGAFNDDGLFHPFPAGVVQSFPGGSTEDGTEIEGGTCTLAGSAEWGSAVAAELWGVDRNGAFAHGHFSPKSPQGRDISYGLLGPHAVSVSYSEGSSQHGESVVPGVGAYLIVQPAAPDSGHEGSGEAPGTQIPGAGPGAVGAVTSITYAENGTTCENGYDARNGARVPVAHSCPPAGAPVPPLQATQASLARVHPSIHLKVSAGRVTAAEISFAAPFPVRGAAQNYAVQSSGCGSRGEGDEGAVFNHNVVKGGTVHLLLRYPFAPRCSGGKRSVEILFDSSAPDAKRTAGRAPGELLLATATIRLPRGDRGTAPPR
jgi:hypothetical protein